MLYSIKTNRRITDIPYQGEYNEHQAIIDELAGKIGNTEVQTSSWMPGKSWANTVFDPIYSKACRGDYDHAAKFFGLLVTHTNAVFCGSGWISSFLRLAPVRLPIYPACFVLDSVYLSKQ